MVPCLIHVPPAFSALTHAGLDPATHNVWLQPGQLPKAGQGSFKQSEVSREQSHLCFTRATCAYMRVRTHTSTDKCTHQHTQAQIHHTHARHAHSSNFEEHTCKSQPLKRILSHVHTHAAPDW